VKFAALFILILTGCASYTTTQEDVSFVGTNVVRRLTTRVTIRTILDARSELTKSAVIQSDKTQSSKIGSANQTATNNIPDVTEKVAKGIIEGLKIP
jgi:hypothetical protein